MDILQLPLQAPTQLLKKLDLRFFSDENHPFAAEPAPAEPHPYAEESSFSRFTEQPNPLVGGGEPVETPGLLPGNQNPTELQQQTIEPPAPLPPSEELLKFGDVEVAADEQTRALHQIYVQQQQDMQRQESEFQQAQQLLGQYQALMQQQQAMQPPAPQQQQAPTIDAARIQQLHEEYQERAYENKFEADQWWQQQPEVQDMERQRLDAMVQQRVNDIVGPIQQEREYQQQVSQARSQYTDFDNYTNEMQQILEGNPALAEYPNAIDNLYWMAKGRAAQAAPQPEQLLTDPAFQQQILANEQIRNLVLQSYQQQKLNTQPPTVMATQAAAQTPTSLGNHKPRNLSEASAAFLNYMGNQ